jgi:hypothetical protein
MKAASMHLVSLVRLKVLYTKSESSTILSAVETRIEFPNWSQVEGGS